MRNMSIICLFALAVLPFWTATATSGASIGTYDVQGMYQFDNDGDRLDDRIGDLPPSSPFFAFVHARPGAGPARLSKDLERGGFEVMSIYDIVPVCSVKFGSAAEAEKAAAAPSVAVIELQRDLLPHLDVSSGAVKASSSDVYSPKTARDMGYNGTGVTIAVLDSGVDNEHETFRGAFAAGVDFTLPQTPLSPRDGTFDPDDRFGHGTGVASVALGRGDREGRNEGVAPAAGLIDLKVLTTRPSGVIPSTQNLLDALQWCVDNKGTDWPGPYIGVQVISLSVSIGEQGGAIYNALDQVVSSGMVVTQSSGNSGATYEEQTETSWPDLSIAVSGTDDMNTLDRDDDEAWDQSTYGPRSDDGDTNRFDELKPDVSAPAANIEFAAFSRTSDLQPAQGWTSGSGTSFSAPHAAGVAALMLQARPDLTPSGGSNPIKLIIHRTAEQRGGAFNSTLTDRYNVNFGWGMLDAYEAVRTSKVFTGENSAPEILDLRVVPGTVTAGSVCRVEADAFDPDEEMLSYSLGITGGLLSGSGPLWEWTAPMEPGPCTLTLTVTDTEGSSDSLSIDVEVLEGPPNRPPDITLFKANPSQVRTGGISSLTVAAKDLDGDPISFSYDAVLGSVTGSGDTATYNAPAEPGTDRVTVKAEDPKGAYSTRELEIKVVSSQTNRAPSIMFLEVRPNILNRETANLTFVLTAQVSDPDGASDIKYVLANLSRIGFISGQEMKDDGSPPDEDPSDLTYSVQLPDLSGLQNGEYYIDVTVVDWGLLSSTQSVMFTVELSEDGDVTTGRASIMESLTGPVLIAVLAAFLLLVVIILLVVRSRSKKKGYVDHPALPRVRFRPSGPGAGGNVHYGNPVSQHPIQAGPSSYQMRPGP